MTALAGDPSCHEVPESNPAVVAAHSEHCPSPVELGYEGFGSTLILPELRTPDLIALLACAIFNHVGSRAYKHRLN